VRTWGCPLPPFDPASVRTELGRGQLAVDDAIDAAACLTTAARVRDGLAVVLPSDQVERDRRGLRMEIVA
jgi:hypothetical protein